MRSLCITRGFGVLLLNDARQIRPRPTPVAMATKCGENGYNSAYIKYIAEMFASNRGFRGRAIE